MLSVIIPTLNAEASLPRSLASLVPAAVSGLVREVIIVDGGSKDATLDIVEAAGTRLVRSGKGRGRQLADGAAAARGNWLLFVYPGTVLQSGWEHEVETLLEHISSNRFRTFELAASFRLALDDFSFTARFVEKAVALRSWFFGLPHGDQGLLINRRLYERLGGHRDLPRLEDVDLMHRISRRKLIMLRSQAVVSGQAYLDGSVFMRMMRNALTVLLSLLRVPPRFLARLYRST